MLTLLALLLLLLVLVIIGLPISIALLLSGIAIFWWNGIPMQTIPLRLFNSVMTHDLLAIPLFIVMGQLLSDSGLASRLIAFANSLVGFMRGGLAMVNVVTGMFLSEMSGASTADAAILSKVFVPSMARAGYSRGFAAGVTCASSSLAIIIPPSIPMILLGLYTDISVAQLFLAGFIPGLLLTLFQLVLCYILARGRGYPTGEPFSITEVGRRLVDCWFVLLIPVVILGSIFTGLATITESALFGLLAALIGSVVYGRLGVVALARIFAAGIRQAAIILFIVSASTLVAWVFANQQIAQTIVTTAGAMHVPGWVHLLWMNVLLFILGTFLHGSATIIIVAPLLLPLALNLGIDPLQFGMIIVISQAIGQQTPPVASVLLTVSSVSGVPMEEILPTLGIFLLTFVAILLVIICVPQVSTLLPQLVSGR